MSYNTLVYSELKLHYHFELTYIVLFLSRSQLSDFLI